jgi:hypothetical protein
VESTRKIGSGYFDSDEQHVVLPLGGDSLSRVKS